MLNRRELIKSFAALGGASFLPVPAYARGALNPTGYLRTNWSKDPYSLGSYSYVAKGSRQQDRLTMAAPIDDKVFFAGEACHPDYNSTVHSAFESGIMSADDILQTNARSVAIVGAGTSGLAAASRLADSGVSVTVVEARDRIGGRIWTTSDLGTPLDLGASWIHGIDDNPISELTKRLGIETVKTTDDGLIRGDDGREIPWRRAPDWLEIVTEIQHDAGADLNQINIGHYMTQDDYGGDEVIFPSGYSEIFKGLKGDYDVRLNTEVTAVNLTSQGVSLGLSGESLEPFDAVLITVPLGVLKSNRIRFDPILSKKKRDAIDRLGMGTLDKVYLKFDDVFWDKRDTWIATPETGLPRGQFNSWLNFYKYFDVPILMAFNGGSPALELAEMPDAEILRRAQSVLEKAYPA